MSTSLINEDDIIRLSNVIRQKNGTSTRYGITAMPDAIRELNTDSHVPVDPVSVDILNDTIVDLTDPDSKIKSVTSYSLYRSPNLETVSLPACTSIGVYSFAECHNLRTISIPKCGSIPNNAFDDCENLEYLGDGYKAGGVGSYGFRNCTGLTEYKTNGGGTINSSAFYGCSNIVTMHFKGAMTFYSGFQQCYSLETIILEYDKKVAESYQHSGNILTWLADTKILTTGHILVPSVLIDKYRTDPFWEPIASRFDIYIPDIPPEPDPESGT